MSEETDIFSDDTFWEGTNKVSPVVGDPVSSVITPTVGEPNSAIEAPSLPIKDESKLTIDEPIVVKLFEADNIPNIKNVGLVPKEYIEIVEDIRKDYRNLPFIKYNDLHKEIKSDAICIKSIPTPSLQSLNQELERVEAAKERLSKVLVDVIHCYNIKKKSVDILKDCWAKHSVGKSADQRAAEANTIITDFRRDFSYVEALFKSCEHIYGVLESAHDTLSRKVTVWQLELKHREMGRGALPDFDYNSQTSRLDNKISEIDPTKPIEAEERDFDGV